MDIYKKYNIKVNRNYKLSSKYRFYFYLRKLFFTTLESLTMQNYKGILETDEEEEVIL